MKENAHTTAVHELADAVQLLLDAAPAGLSPTLLDTLTAAVGRTRTMLPPHLFYAAVEQAPVAISITDPEANILYVNPSFERVTGYGRGEAVGHNESMLSDKCTPVQAYQKLWQQLLAQQVWSGTLVNRRKDGSRYLAELLIAPVVDEGGVTRHYLGLHRDITDLHRLEQQVLNQKHLIEGMVDAAPVAIALLDEQGRISLDNRAYRNLAAELGHDPALDLLFSLHFDPEAPGEPGPVFVDVEYSFEPEEGNVRWFTWSGSRIVAEDDSAGGFFSRPARSYLLLVAQEITRLKQQQEEVRRNALRALVSEEARVQGMREAIAAAEFQMQGPFNMLKAALGMLERRAGGEGGDPLMGVLNQALAAGQETLEMLRSAMPRERREPLTRLNLNQLLRDALSLVTERMLALGVEVEWRPAARLPPLSGYENRLRAVFKQILDNALDAMSAGRVRRRELRVVTDTVGDALRVVIEDTGPGIPDELRLKVFEPFFTTRGDGHTGTGLSMVQEVVNQHGGTIWLEHTPDGGCRVQLQLPVRATRNH